MDAVSICSELWHRPTRPVSHGVLKMGKMSCQLNVKKRAVTETLCMAIINVLSEIENLITCTCLCAPILVVNN